MPGESFQIECACIPAPGTVAPSLAPYVRSLNDLQGLVTIAGSGAVDVTSSGNTIFIDLSADAGLGSVTSVALASSNSNLTVASGSPITTLGTITLDLAGNLDSISGLTMAADEMLYSTGAATFATTSLPAFGRTLIANASAADARTDLGLVIGTNVQAWSADLDSLVTVSTFAGTDLTLSGALTVGGASGFTVTNSASVGGDFGVTGDVTFAASLTVDTITATSVSGNGSGLTNLNATNLTTGTTAVARGGTGIASYAIGDLIIATGATTLTKLPDVAAGAFLRSGGVTTAPVWSTTLWPNTLTTGDILYASSTTQVSRLANVATGNVLLSGGVGVASTFGKVTTSHTTGIAASGSNGDITTLSALTTVSSAVQFTTTVSLGATLEDGSAFVGDPGNVLTSSGSSVAWSTQIGLDALDILTELSMEGTITGSGTTGAQVINKICGTVRFAAGASSLVVTNSLCTTSHRVLAMVCTNDTTATVKNVVTTSGAFTIVLEANATAESEVYWELRKIT